MSIEEIIKRFEDDPEFGWPHRMEEMGYDRDAQALRVAIALLRTHPDNQPNDPLTFEELKKMDGQPVWLNTLCEWFFVDASREPILLWGVRATCYSTVGLLGELYRRPPKEA